MRFSDMYPKCQESVILAPPSLNSMCEGNNSTKLGKPNTGGDT